MSVVCHGIMRCLQFTNPLLCDTRQAPLEWDFTSTNKTTKVEMTKATYELDPLRQISLRAGMAGQRVPFVTLCRRLSGYLTGHTLCTCICPFWRVETWENMLTGHKARLSVHERRWKENFLWFLRRWPTAKLSQQTLICRELWVCAASGKHRLMGLRLGSSLWFSLLGQCHKRPRGERWPSLEGKGSIGSKSALTRFLPESLYPRN